MVLQQHTFTCIFVMLLGFVNTWVWSVGAVITGCHRLENLQTTDMGVSLFRSLGGQRSGFSMVRRWCRPYSGLQTADSPLYPPSAKEEFSGVSLNRAQIPPMRVPRCDLITSHRPHLPTASHQGPGFNTGILGRPNYSVCVTHAMLWTGVPGL